jgi:hypothetical protein
MFRAVFLIIPAFPPRTGLSAAEGRGGMTGMSGRFSSPLAPALPDSATSDYGPPLTPFGPTPQPLSVPQPLAPAVPDFVPPYSASLGLRPVRPCRPRLPAGRPPSLPRVRGPGTTPGEAGGRGLRADLSLRSRRKRERLEPRHPLGRTVRSRPVSCAGSGRRIPAPVRGCRPGGRPAQAGGRCLVRPRSPGPDPFPPRLPSRFRRAFSSAGRARNEEPPGRLGSPAGDA